jgi:hypothetical protein
MTYIVENPPTVNGNGGGIVKGRGLRHRKMSRSEALQLAADVASGRPFVPSLHHLADIFGVPIGSLSKAVKARTEFQKKNATEVEEVTAEPPGPFGALVLARAWYSAPPNDREWFVREVGVDAVWDVIARLIR